MRSDLMVGSLIRRALLRSSWLIRRSVPLILSLVLSAAHSAPLHAQAVASYDSAWSAISRTYFDTAFVHGRWQRTHDSLRTALGVSPSADDVRGAIRALITVSGASHFVLIPGEATAALSAGGGPRGAPGTVGLDLRMIGDTLVVWRVAAASAAASAGIRPGQIVTQLDSLKVTELRAQLASAFSTDRKRAHGMIANVANARVHKNTGDTVRVALVDARGRPQEILLVHTPLAGQLSRYGNLPPIIVRVTHDSVRVGRGRRATMVPVIGWSGWFPAISPEIDRSFFAARDARGLIIDLRGNPGGVVGMIGGVAGHLTDSVVNLGTMRGRGSTLRLNTNPRLVDGAGVRRGIFRGPVAILVDEQSASASEFFAAGLQAIGRARVFGDASAGQALPAAMQRLPSGDVLMYPIADHETPNGGRVEGVGVVPDVPAPLTRRALRDGRDPALDAARAWLARTIQ